MPIARIRLRLTTDQFLLGRSLAMRSHSELQIDCGLHLNNAFLYTYANISPESWPDFVSQCVIIRRCITPNASM